NVSQSWSARKRKTVRAPDCRQSHVSLAVAAKRMAKMRRRLHGEQVDKEEQRPEIEQAKRSFGKSNRSLKRLRKSKALAKDELAAAIESRDASFEQVQDVAIRLQAIREMH